jgi:hypothetical protein
MNFLLEDFNDKAGMEDIFKPTVGNESIYEISNDNGARIVNSATSQNFIVKSTFSYIVTFINLIGHLLMQRDTTKLTIFLYIGDGIQVYLMSDHSGAADCDTDHYLVVANLT